MQSWGDGYSYSFAHGVQDRGTLRITEVTPTLVHFAGPDPILTKGNIIKGHFERYTGFGEIDRYN